MRAVLSIMLMISGLMSTEDFITEFEYGQMLYHDPHGASCVACHGETGEGKTIVEYTDKKGEYISLTGPEIRNATLEQIRNSTIKGRGVMPVYFLTDQEIKTIYTFLHSVGLSDVKR